MSNVNVDFTWETKKLYLRQTLNLRQIVSQFWGGPERSSGKYDVYASRWRDDGRKPSFTVYADHYRDYGGSGESGDVFDFLQRELRLGFKDAVDYATTLGGTTPIVHHSIPRQGTQDSHREPPSITWQRIAADERDRAAQYLWSDRPDANRVVDYLRTKRGLTDETIRRWHLGYNPRWRKTEHHDPETGKPVWLAPGITVPVFCDDGLWGLRVRCRVGNLAEWLEMSDEKGKGGERLPKYLNLAGSRLSGSLFNGDAIQAGHSVLIVEGEFDAILAQQELGNQITAITLGSATNHLTPHWIDRLKGASHIYLALDADAAGQEAADALQKTLSHRATPLQLPSGKDITDFVVEHDGQLQDWFEQTSCLTFFSGGLPDSWRSAVLTYLGGSAALLLEILTEAARQQRINPNDFTLGQIAAIQHQLGFGLSTATLYRAFQDGEGVFFAKLQTDSKGVSVSSFEKNAAVKGRRAERYRLLPITLARSTLLKWGGAALYQKHHPVEGNPVLARPRSTMIAAIGVAEREAQAVADALDRMLHPAYDAQGHAQIPASRRAAKAYSTLVASLEDHHSTPLPEDWLLVDVPTYRAAFLRGTHHPDTPRSRSQIARLLGISPRTVDHMIKRAGLENVPQPLEERPIINPGSAEQEVQAQARLMQAFPRALVARNASGHEIKQPYRASDARAFAAAYLSQGYEIHVQFQVANRQRVVRDTAPTPSPRRFSATPSVPRRCVRLDRQNQPKMGYSREWLVGQLKLACHLLGYPMVAGSVIDPDTGEVLPDDPPTLLTTVLRL